MKVLVTGGCGFLGSHVCEYYRNKGWEVISYDNMTKYELSRTGFALEASRDYNWSHLEKLDVKLVKEDVRDYQTLLHYAKGCDYIVHTAAQPAMTISWENPRLDIETNLMGTFNVLEAAREYKIPVGSCATGHVYGNDLNNQIKELNTRYTRDPAGVSEKEPTLTGVLTPLHASKGAGDIYVKTYIDTYKLEACSFRLSGIYGTRQFGGEDHGWVANFAIRAITDRPLTVFGNGKQIRDIIYVTDVCRAFDAFFETRASGIYNIGGGTNTAISLIECIDLIEKLNKRKATIKYEADRHGDLRYFICDIEKAKKDLNWEPEILPEQGVTMLMDWIKSEKDIFMEKTASEYTR
ncbi:MAG: NAD-dependent epimerase/dehydratase family protein [bacterium]